MIKTTIYGNPVPKSRPRFVPGAHFNPHTPKRTRDAEKRVLAHMVGLLGEDGLKKVKKKLVHTNAVSVPLGINATFYRENQIDCDLDNLFKLLTDACNKIVYTDDKWIHGFAIDVVRGVGKTQARTEIEIISHPQWIQPIDWTPTGSLFYLSLADDPKPKERPRMGNGRVYTPQNTTTWEDKIRGAVETIMGQNGLYFREGKIHHLNALQGDLGMIVQIRRANHIQADLDNLVKAVMDAFNRLAYADDKQIVSLAACLERGSSNAGIEVVLTDTTTWKKKVRGDYGHVNSTNTSDEHVFGHHHGDSREHQTSN